MRQLVVAHKIQKKAMTRYAAPLSAFDASFVINSANMARFSTILLPQECIKCIVAQPDSVLVIFKFRKVRHALGYLDIAEKQKATVAFLDKSLGRCLTKNLNRIQPDVRDEIRAGLMIRSVWKSNGMN